ncbi:aldehyde dehydrogenase [Nocardia sp. NPDC050712]|uniref:aldehyde dehydrogenase n=1 Tax=Nocardia sp. NPDC050712 TaxID=3155518 RepID=UPI0033E485A9
MSYERTELFIDGRWRAPSTAATSTVISPATGAAIGTIPQGGTSDVDAAVDAAGRALRSKEWGAISLEERVGLLSRLATELERTAATRAELTSVQNGMPITLSVGAEGAGPPALLRYYAAIAASVPVEERRPRLDGKGITVVRREPVGVVAAIVPWNYPQLLTMFKVAPALAAGCTVVLKPAPETTLDALELAAAAERAGLPPGVLNVVSGGADVGAHLVAHPGVHKVAFTGSTGAGRAIGEICGRLLRPATLELGGKSAAIVLDDADLTTITQGLASSSLLNNGQTCHLSTRILVPRQRADEVLGAVVAVAESLTIGDPLDPATELGPMVSERQRRRVEDYIELGRAGGVLATGGGRPDRDQGWFVEPTVFGGVRNDSRIAREEIFGPVLTVIGYDDLDEAVTIANDSEYGLGGTVWTADIDRGLEVARRVETGTIGINFYDPDLGAPFGGVKSSGLGRELGPEGFFAYQQLKSIYLPQSATPGDYPA